jgi:hypothetical protein
MLDARAAKSPRQQLYAKIPLELKSRRQCCRTSSTVYCSAANQMRPLIALLVEKLQAVIDIDVLSAPGGLDQMLE